MLGQSTIQWQNVKASGVTIPPFAITEPDWAAGVTDYGSDNRISILLKQVEDIGHSPLHYFVNDHLELGAQVYGRAVPAIVPMWIQCRSICVAGESWGPEVGAWDLVKDHCGFISLGEGVSVSGIFIALFMADTSSLNHRVRFEITSVNMSSSSGPAVVDSVQGSVLASLCCSGPLPEESGGEVTIYDGLGCLFDEQPDDLVGLVGYASYMLFPYSDPPPPGPYISTCRWEVDQLCCPTVGTGSIPV